MSRIARLIRRRERKEAASLLRMFIAFLLVASLYLFSVGVWKINSCSGKPYLPTLMIIIALLIVTDRLIFWRRLVNKAKFEKAFPSPYFFENTETIKKWEENRLRSSSRTLLWLMIAVRVAILVVVIIGKLWSFDVVLTDQCDYLVSCSTIVFCVSSIVIFLFFFIFVEPGGWEPFTGFGGVPD